MKPIIIIYDKVLLDFVWNNNFLFFSYIHCIVLYRIVSYSINA